MSGLRERYQQVFCLEVGYTCSLVSEKRELEQFSLDCRKGLVLVLVLVLLHPLVG